MFRQSRSPESNSGCNIEYRKINTEINIFHMKKIGSVLKSCNFNHSLLIKEKLILHNLQQKKYRVL